MGRVRGVGTWHGARGEMHVSVRMLFFVWYGWKGYGNAVRGNVAREVMFLVVLPWLPFSAESM